MKIKIPNKNYELIEFYETVATEIGYTDTSELHYDCTKIKIAENIQEGFYEYYKANAKKINPFANENDVTISTTMVLACKGPKVDSRLKAGEVEIFEGFIC